MTIRHRLGAYDVRMTDLSSALASLPQDSVVITDEIVATHYEAALAPFTCLKVEPGEKSKSLRVAADLCSKLAQLGASRKTPLVAFGGGVVGDLAGFVAATYVRGVAYHQIPTTLLAQVDSSVGGKVGVDLPEGKNLVGAFWPPESVAIAPQVLETLPRREFCNGAAEVAKYGFIMDAPLCQRMGNGLALDDEDLPSIIERCVELKAQVVAEDEFETTGKRAILNFGHTVGHAIEVALGYGLVLHGEAVSIGMVAEARLGERLGITEAGVAAEVERVLAANGLPTTHPVLAEPDLLLQAMRRDKKSSGGKIGFSLVPSLGSCRFVPHIAEDDIREGLRQ